MMGDLERAGPRLATVQSLPSVASTPDLPRAPSAAGPWNRPRSATAPDTDGWKLVAVVRGGSAPPAAATDSRDVGDVFGQGECRDSLSLASVQAEAHAGGDQSPSSSSTVTVEESCGSTAKPTRASGGEGGMVAVPLGMGKAAAVAAAAAASAAERGSRASLEAAAAARRWEAKLKGSLMSMTGGVRWGM